MKGTLFGLAAVFVGRVRRGRQVKCAAGVGGGGDCIAEDCIVYR